MDIAEENRNIKLGICGEHSHPHLLNIGYIALAMFILYSIVKLKSRLNG